MKWFASIDRLDALKAEYRKLVMRWHPDRPEGSTEVMASINAEYDVAFEALKRAANSRAERYDSCSWEHTEETPEEFRNIIAQLLVIDDVEIELCGRWIWVTGDTRPHAAELKAAGCRWSAKKVAWYWHSPKDGFKRRRGSKSMQSIRDTYGSKRFTRSNSAIMA